MRKLLMSSCLSLSLVVFLSAALPAVAQDRAQTLADIRQELTVLHVEIQRLKRELSTTGAPGTELAGSSVLDRVGAMESELRQLTARTEEMNHRVERIVKDGTNRIGDLEFRLVELEGGDLSQLGETTTLGGPVADPAAGTASAEAADTVAEDTPADPAEAALAAAGELAVGERDDFKAAMTAYGAGAFADAAEKFAVFQTTYPGSPLAPEVDYNRGKALSELGDTREAARSYLAAFSGAPTGNRAADALFELGAALGKLDQVDQACITLAEVDVRFPGSPAVAQAAAERQSLGCP